MSCLFLCLSLTRTVHAVLHVHIRESIVVDTLGLPLLLLLMSVFGTLFNSGPRPFGFRSFL